MLCTVRPGVVVKDERRLAGLANTWVLIGLRRARGSGSFCCAAIASSRLLVLRNANGILNLACGLESVEVPRQE